MDGALELLAAYGALLPITVRPKQATKGGLPMQREDTLRRNLSLRAAERT